jgi:uncharacterized protein (DUF488 family)
MTLQSDTSAITVYTIGHSTHPLGEFIGILEAHGVRQVVDVRTIPRSRHNPQFNSDALEAGLQASGIGYAHLKLLGGLRHAKKVSVNQGWENVSFRGFADHMQTEEFEEGLLALIALAGEQATAVMCAEAVPWKCHRSLIADALFVRGIAVMHIMSRTAVRPHALTPWAEVKGTSITYPAPQS